MKAPSRSKLPAEVCSRKGHPDLHRNGEVSPAPQTLRSRPEGAGSRLHSFGTESGLPNWSRFVPAILIIDLVVASVTLSIGMVQLPPVMVSAPFKILLFVLVDGWNLVVGSLLKSFY